jgi:hypothetical protein
MEWSGIRWIDLAHDGLQWKALVKTIMDFAFP